MGLLHLWTRLHAELVDEHPAHVLIGVEGVRGPPGMVQRDDQLRPERLLPGMLPGQPDQIADDLAVAAEFEADLHPPFLCAQEFLRQRSDLVALQRLRRDVAECGTPPAGEGFVEPSQLGGQVTGLLRRRDRLLEPKQVQLIGGQPDQVAVRPRFDRRTFAVAQHAPQAEGVQLGALPDGRRWTVTPKPFTEFLDRDRRVRT